MSHDDGSSPPTIELTHTFELLDDPSPRADVNADPSPSFGVLLYTKDGVAGSGTQDALGVESAHMLITMPSRGRGVSSWRSVDLGAMIVGRWPVESVRR